MYFLGPQHEWKRKIHKSEKETGNPNCDSCSFSGCARSFIPSLPGRPFRVAIEKQDLRAFVMPIGRANRRLREILLGFVAKRGERSRRSLAAHIRIGPAAIHRAALIQTRHAIRTGAAFFQTVRIVRANENLVRVNIGRAQSLTIPANEPPLAGDRSSLSCA